LYYKKEDERKAKKKKKYILKRFAFLTLILFFLGNVYLYIGFYNNYVTNAPKTLKEARKDMIVAHIFSLYEVMAIRLGLSFQNPILKPLQIAKEHFYYKGIEKFPKDEAERAYWYGMCMFYQIATSTNSQSYDDGGMAKYFGVEFAKNYLDDLYINLELLANHKVTDYENKYVKKRVAWYFLMMFDQYVHNFHLHPDVGFLRYQATNEAQDNSKIAKLISVYSFGKTFFENEKYEKEIEKYIFSDYPDYRLYNEMFFDANIMILYNRLYHSKFSCNKTLDRVLMRDYLHYKSKLQEIIDEKKLKPKSIKYLKHLTNVRFVREEQEAIDECIKQGALKWEK
jgi:hypothetical protein